MAVPVSEIATYSLVALFIIKALTEIVRRAGALIGVNEDKWCESVPPNEVVLFDFVLSA